MDGPPKAQDPLRFAHLDVGEWDAGGVKWDIVGGDSFRSKIKQASSHGVPGAYEC